MAYAMLSDEWIPPATHRTFSDTREKTKLYALKARANTTYSAINEIPTYSVIQKLNTLKTWGANWDGRNAIAVNSKTVDLGMTLVNQIYETTLEMGMDWYQPNVTASAHGEAVLEWWNRQKKLTIYISSEQTDYVKIWGADIDAEMEDGILTSLKVAELITWLKS